MFRRKTAFIIGAGASVDLGFPSGDGLKTEIAAMLELDAHSPFGFKNTIISGVLQNDQSQDPAQFKSFVERMRQAASKIIRALPSHLSIDNLVHSLQDMDVARLAKLAIAIIILEAERTSLFWQSSMLGEELLDARRSRRRRIDIRNDEMMKAWYYPLASLLFADVKKDDIAAAFKNVTFIIFNYDRCLEQFIYEVLQDSYNIDGATASDILAQARFIHPYGSLGPLDWELTEEGPHLPLGHTNGVDYWKLVDSLMTFTETVRSDVGQQIKTAVGSAYAHIYLGFGYLGQNIDLLTPVGNRLAGMAIGTAYGFSSSDQQIVELIMDRLGRDVGLTHGVEPGKCLSLFENRRLEMSTI